MAILITGAAGFIGFHLARSFLARGEQVIGIDNINDYYDLALKNARLSELHSFPGFSFLKMDIATDIIGPAIADRSIDTVIHLAAYAGVRYSLSHPKIYLEKNILGQLALLEWIKHLDRRPYFIYASSSSVYGGCLPPFKETEEHLVPLSPYAVSKRSAELLSQCYTELHGIQQTGLRFFTVYGPWGRPDMAYYKFAAAILAGQAITIHGDGTMRRDFTYIDDIVRGIAAIRSLRPAGHTIYNLGNDRPQSVEALIQALEESLGTKAHREYGPALPGEVPTTWADISLARRELGYAPSVDLAQGIGHFVSWYKDYSSRVSIKG
jgi:UDP-glucuronate 4-epimerase